MTVFRDQSAQLAACVFVLTVPAYLCLALRIYIRLWRRTWGADDWCLVVASFLFIGCCVTCIIGPLKGVGVGDTQLHKGEDVTGMMWWTLFTVFYCSGIIPTKLSIGFTLLRIAETKVVYRWALYIVMLGFTIVSMVVFLFVMLQCRPFAANWDKTIPGMYCIDSKTTTEFSFALSSTNIITDWIIAALPLPLLWKTQMDTKTKFSVGGLLSLGIIASIAAIVRLKYTIALSSSSNFLLGIKNVQMWAYVEFGLGIIVASMTALRPLLERLGWTQKSHQSDTPLEQWAAREDSRNKWPKRSLFSITAAENDMEHLTQRSEERLSDTLEHGKGPHASDHE